MKKEFLKLAEKINNSQNQEELEKIIKEWEIKNEDVEAWIDELFDSIQEIDINRMPYVLNSLYKENDKIKFLFFCILLENTYSELPFITNLENIPLFKEKYEMLAPTLVKVAKNSYNGIADCMYLILLNSDPKGNFLKPEEKETLLFSINDKLTQIISYLNECNENEIDNSVYIALEILLDISSYINNIEILNLLDQFENLKINKDSKLFLIKTKAANNMKIDDNIFKELAEDDNYSYRLLQVLEETGKLDIYPKELLNQEKIAKLLMVDWLKYPTELNDEPADITFVDTIENENIIYYIFKFTAKEGALKEKGYMIGVSGGFYKDKISSQNTGHTFSNFETITENYKNQAEEIIALISNHWKNRNK